MKNKIHHHSWKDHIKNSKSAKFDREMLKNAENIALQNLPILYTFTPKVVRISACNTKVYKIGEFFKAIFSAFFNISRPHFCNFTIFEMIFSAVVMDFVFHVLKKM